MSALLPSTSERLPGVAGVKGISPGSSTGTLLLSEEDAIFAALKGGSRRMAVHSEDEARLKERKSLSRQKAIRVAIPFGAMRKRRASRLNRGPASRKRNQAGRRLHVLHVTTEDELPLLAAARDFATVETTPQHVVDVGGARM